MIISIWVAQNIAKAFIVDLSVLKVYSKAIRFFIILLRRYLYMHVSTNSWAHKPQYWVYLKSRTVYWHFIDCKTEFGPIFYESISSLFCLAITESSSRFTGVETFNFTYKWPSSIGIRQNLPWHSSNWFICWQTRSY